MVQNQEKMKALGFSLYLKDGKWYAVKSIEGRLRWVYVGETLEKAEEKIRDWCTKNGIVVKTETEVVGKDFSNIVEKLAKEVEELKTAGQVMENRVVTLETKNEELWKRLENIEKRKEESGNKARKEKMEERKNEKAEAKEVGKSIALGQLIQGFKVIEKTARGIRQYQAYKRNGGKQCYVYLCPSVKPVNLAEAEKKIRQYCEKYKVAV
jgi:regulator of replication initiation timing